MACDEMIQQCQRKKTLLSKWWAMTVAATSASMEKSVLNILFFDLMSFSLPLSPIMYVPPAHILHNLINTELRIVNFEHRILFSI